MFTWETAEKCIMFAWGRNGSTLFTGVKGADFPESLLRFEGKTAQAAALMDEGKSSYEAAEIMGFTQQSAFSQMSKVRDRRKFYSEWNTFLEVLDHCGVGALPLSEIPAFAAQGKKATQKRENNGVLTVKDFLVAACGGNQEYAYRKSGISKAHYNVAFGQVKETVKKYLALHPCYPEKEEGRSRKAAKKKDAAAEKGTDMEGQLTLFDFLPHGEENAK